MEKITQIREYTVHDYPGEALPELKLVWERLEQGADMTAFQSYDWYQNLQAIHQAERTKNLFRELRYMTVFCKDRPILIAPLEIHKSGVGYKQYGAPRGVYFIGRLGYTDYLNFVYDEFNPDAAEALIAYVSKAYSQRKFYFDRMLESTASYQYLCSKYRGESNPIQCAALVLPATFEEYRSLLSKSTKQNIRTANNRAKKNDLLLTHELIHDEDPAVKEAIIALNAQRHDKKNKASRSQMSTAGRIYCFFAEIYRKLFSVPLDVVRVSKNTFCFLVKDGEKIVSFFWGIRNDYLHEYYVILAGVDKEYEWYSPNISHLYLFVEEYYQQARQDIRIIDFTRGGEGYKKTIGCTVRRTNSLRFSK